MSAPKFTVIQCATCGKECRCKASQARKYCSVVCCNAHPDTKASRARNAEKMRGRAKVKKNCLECGGEFEALASQVKRGKGLSCSWECSYKLRARKMSEDRKGKRISPATEFKRGQKPWNAGTAQAPRSERMLAMGRIEYREWRSAVFVRDDYTCQVCGVRGVQLHADHILPWVSHPELRYDLNNGRALCVPCHRDTPTFGSRALKMAQRS